LFLQAPHFTLSLFILVAERFVLAYQAAHAIENLIFVEKREEVERKQIPDASHLIAYVVWQVVVFENGHLLALLRPNFAEISHENVNDSQHSNDDQEEHLDIAHFWREVSLGLLCLQRLAIILHDLLSLTLKVPYFHGFLLQNLVTFFCDFRGLLFVFGECFVETLGQFLLELIVVCLEFIVGELYVIKWGLFLFRNIRLNPGVLTLSLWDHTRCFFFL
jgi:hypothetical protein